MSEREEYQTKINSDVEDKHDSTICFDSYIAMRQSMKYNIRFYNPKAYPQVVSTL